MSSRPPEPLSDVNGSTRRGGCALAIMFKAPAEGRVKTRLTPPLTPGAAAELSRCMIRDTAENIAGVCRTVVATGVAVYTPVGAEAAIDPLLPPGFIRVAQRGDGFGDRLANAAADLLDAGFSSLCLIDSDSPTLPAATLAAAARALEADGDRVVLAGADDGGYCLIGLKARHQAVFQGIDWSTSRVHAQTIDRARAAGLTVIQLPEWYDVDDGESLARICRELLGGGASNGYAAPHTRRFLVHHPYATEALGDWRSSAEADAR